MTTPSDMDLTIWNDVTQTEEQLTSMVRTLQIKIEQQERKINTLQEENHKLKSDFQERSK